MIFCTFYTLPHPGLLPFIITDFSTITNFSLGFFFSLTTSSNGFLSVMAEEGDKIDSRLVNLLWSFRNGKILKGNKREGRAYLLAVSPDLLGYPIKTALVLVILQNSINYNTETVRD